MDKFFSPEHKAKIERLESLWNNLHGLSEMAKEFGIEDMLQDNGLKVMQQLIYLNMDLLPGREGNDSVSPSGAEWEMKSINILLTSGFSTNHHTTLDIITKYRSVPWSFSIYEDITLKEIYVMKPETLEPMFSKWEEQLSNGRGHLNNPKIPVKFVREHGLKVFPYALPNPIDPDSINLP